MKVAENLVLDIKITNAKVNIENYPPRMKAKTIKAEMKIERQAPSFKKVRVRRAAQTGQRKRQPARLRGAGVKAFVLETVKYISADKQNKNVHRLENNISKLAPGENPLCGINAALHEERISEETQLIWDPGSITTTWTQPKTLIEWDIRRPKITVEPYSVEIKVRRQPKKRFAAPRLPAKNKVDKKA